MSYMEKLPNKYLPTLEYGCLDCTSRFEVQGEGEVYKSPVLTGGGG
jgi:predicted nucleic acid-binding Zn ribbon protein